MQTQAATPEYEDLNSHRQMWGSFTGFVLKGIISTVIVLVLLAVLTLLSGFIFLKVVTVLVALLLMLVIWMGAIV